MHSDSKVNFAYETCTVPYFRNEVRVTKWGGIVLNFQLISWQETIIIKLKNYKLRKIAENPKKELKEKLIVIAFDVD